MSNPTDVGLVDTHTKSDRRNHNKSVFLLEAPLNNATVFRLHPTVVMTGGMPRLSQRLRDGFRFGSRAAIDNPRLPFSRGRERQYLLARLILHGKGEVDIRTVKSAQERNGGNAIKQLFNDFRLSFCISRRGKGRKWHAQRPPQLANPQIIWAKIVAPLANAMRFIDRNHAHANATQHLRYAARGQPLWRHIQELETPLFQRLPDGIGFFLSIARGQRASLNPSFT